METDLKLTNLTVCHKSNVPARAMAVLRLNDLPAPYWDWQLTLTCLQGLANRATPRLFLVQDLYDELWLEWLMERGDLDTLTRLTAEATLLRFCEVVEGVVVVDPAIPASFNVATMLAGITNRLVVTPSLAQQLQARLPAHAAANVIDLCGMHWSQDVEAYRWFYDRYYDRLTQRMCAMLDPYDLPLRDYMVEFRLPLFWIRSGYDAAEAAFAEELLLRLPPNIPCLGWPVNACSRDPGVGEHMGVVLINECAKFEVCSGFEIVGRAVSNLSVHSGTTATLTPKWAPVLPLEPDKVYVTFIRTDGDGPNFWRECYRSLWEDAEHGRFPMGWQQGPTLYDLMPDVLDWFYQHATTNDSFVNALTGIGYIHEENYAYLYPVKERRRIWQEYLRLSRAYREKLGLVALTTYHEIPPDMLQDLCRLGFQGVFANYQRSFVTSLHNQVEEVAGVPVFRTCISDVPFGKVDLNGVAGDIHRWTPRVRPAFVYVSLSNWVTRMEYVQGIINQLGSDYVPVTPEQLIGLYWQAKEHT
jgi:hypothetical protein